MQAIRVHRGDYMDYTPAAAVALGQVVVLNSLVGIAERPIEANVQGALALVGVFDVVKANGEITAGSPVYWDADGNPEGGEAGSGCATTVSDGNTLMGHALKDAAATDETVRVRLTN